MATRKKPLKRGDNPSAKRPATKAKPRKVVSSYRRTATRKKAPKIGKPTSKPVTPAMQIKVPVYAMQTYEHAMVYDILTGNSEKASSPESLDMLSILSGATDESKASSFAAGVNAGRILHEFSRLSRPGKPESERIPDMQLFFSNAGYKNVSYSIFTDKFMLRFEYGANAVGIKGHAFEAGMIEGFLNALGYQGFHIREVKCMMEGNPYCSFSSSGMFSRQEGHGTPLSKSAVAALSESVSAKVMSGSSQAQFSEAYAVLRGKQSLSYAAGHGGMSMAFEMGRTIRSNTIEGKRDAAAKAAMERTISLLNIGRINVKSLEPLKLELSVSLLKSRQEFNDFAETFIKGLVGYHKPAGPEAKASADGGHYVLRLNSPSKG